MRGSDVISITYSAQLLQHVMHANAVDGRHENFIKLQPNVVYVGGHNPVVGNPRHSLRIEKILEQRSLCSGQLLFGGWLLNVIVGKRPVH